MMKRFFNIIFVALASFSFGGCTLMMDDLEKEEENVDLETVGFDKPYTEKTEFGDVTFQYGDSTQVLRKKALDYLVEVDHDTILYFSDNIPKDLLVPVGKYVSMGCNEKLRHGLCSKVISLTKENGMFRMETTRVCQTKVYKQFDVDISLDYDQQMAFDPEEYLEEQDATYMENDTVTVFTDWAFFGKDVVERKEAEIRKRIQAKRALTRADNNDDEVDDEVGEYGNSQYSPTDEDTDILKAKDKATRIWTLNTKKISKWGGPFAKLPENGLQLSCAIYYHEKTTLRHIQKVSNNQDYVKDVFDATPYLEFKLKAGWKKQSNTDDLLNEKLFNKIYEGLKNSDFANRHDISAQAFMIHIPIPLTAGAVELFLRFHPKAGVELGILGNVEFTKGLGLVHKEVEYINGKSGKNVFTEDESQNSDFKIKKFDIYGTLVADANVEILAGAAVAGGLFGLGIGFDVGANFTFKKDVNSLNSIILAAMKGIDPYSVFGRFEIYFKPKIKAFSQSPAGKEWMGIEFDIPGVKEKYSIMGPYTWYYYPEIGEPDGYFTIGTTDGRTVANITATYKFPSLNIGGYLGKMSYDPAAVVYRVSGKEEKQLQMVTLKEIINTKDKYLFTYTDEFYKEGDYYKVMPVLYDVIPGAPNVSYYNNMIKCMKEAPELQYLDLFQNNYELRDKKNGGEEELFSFVVKAYIAKLSKMNNWKEWGVKITLFEWNEKELNYVIAKDIHRNKIEDRKFPIKDKITKNSVAAKFSLRADAGRGFRVKAYLYYIDKDHEIERELHHPYYETDEEEDDPMGRLIAKGMINMSGENMEWMDSNSSVGESQLIEMKL